MAEYSTLFARDAIEAVGYQFLKDKQGWACYDTDNRLELKGSRHPTSYGESVWQTFCLIMQEKPLERIT